MQIADLLYILLIYFSAFPFWRRSSSSRPIYHIPRASVKQATTESHTAPPGGREIVTNLAKHFGVPLAQFLTSMASTLIRHKQLVMRKSFNDGFC